MLFIVSQQFHQRTTNIMYTQHYLLSKSPYINIFVQIMMVLVFFFLISVIDMNLSITYFILNKYCNTLFTILLFYRRLRLMNITISLPMQVVLSRLHYTYHSYKIICLTIIIIIIFITV